jgi:hypothetical protein
MKPMRFCQAVVSWTQRCLAALLQEAEDVNDAFGPEDAEDVRECLNMDDEEEEVLSQAESEDLDARHGPNVEVPDSSFSPER